MTAPRLLSDRYELGPALGYGGMSEVHGGRDVRLGRDVAIKVLRADLARDPQFQIRFQREGQNAAALNHPAIVAVYDTGETWADDVPLPYIVMEYVPGRTLRDIVKSGGPMDPYRVCEVMADVCSALDFSHRHGIIHRDVKPANVMITPPGAVKVMDFGIARALSDAQQGLTQTAAVIGTAQYLSPEQARGEAVDARSDVYSAGCVLFELLTGQPPFTGDSPVAVAYQHVREDPKAPSELTPSVPPALDAITLKALAKNPFNRYQTADEMRDDLIRVLQGEQVEAPLVMSEAERNTLMTGPTRAVGRAGAGGAYASGPATEAGDFAAWQAEQSEERARRRRRLLGVVGGVVAVVAVLAGLFFLFSPGNNQLAVPDVTNQPQDVALRTLTGAGLKPNLVPVASDATQVGKVLATDPAAGTEVDPQTVIAMRVGRGPDRVQAPDLTGKTADQAQQIVQGMGLTLTPVPQQKQVDDSSQVGKVLSQDPSAGTLLAPGTAIQLTVGQQRQTIKVPDVTGQPVATARTTLEGVGLEVTVTGDTTDTATVTSTNPAAGTTVAVGSTVTVATGTADRVQVPDIVGKSRSDAVAALAAAGFSGDLQATTQDVDDPNQDGKVLSQTPSAGSQAGKGDTIRVTVGKYTGGGGGTGTGTTNDGGGGNGAVFGGNGLFPGGG